MLTVITPGSSVKICGTIDATINEVHIVRGEIVYYNLTYWHGRELKAVYLPADQVSRERAIDAREVGFQ